MCLTTAGCLAEGDCSVKRIGTKRFHGGELPESLYSMLLTIYRVSRINLYFGLISLSEDQARDGNRASSSGRGCVGKLVNVMLLAEILPPLVYSLLRPYPFHLQHLVKPPLKYALGLLN